MTSHFFMGAINKETNEYEYPKIASKLNKYKCFSCEKDVIFKKGLIKQAHFAHYKSKTPCMYFDRPSESEIHKEAKLMMKSFLDRKESITIYKKCISCSSKPIQYLNIDTSFYSETTNSHIEFKFTHNNSLKSADVALIDDMNNILYIFEICYKNKTKTENRPEPWFEFNAEKLISETNSKINLTIDNRIELFCIREYQCFNCIKRIAEKRKRDFEEMIRLKKIEDERRKYIEKWERDVKIRNEEHKKMMFERCEMKKEDELLIQKERKLKLEKELKRMKIEEEIKRLLKQKEEEKQEILRKEKEMYEKYLNRNAICTGCKINYCKCDSPNYIKNEKNRLLCDLCKKYKCRCIKITSFFIGNKGKIQGMI